MATKVIFTKDFDFRPDANWRVIVEYKASKKVVTVTDECAAKAEKANCATIQPGKDDESRNATQKSKNTKAQ